MEPCSFCYKELKPGTGKLFVKKDGKKLYFCSSKCERNMLKLKRKPHSFKWTKKPKTKEEKEQAKLTKTGSTSSEKPVKANSVKLVEAKKTETKEIKK